MNKRNIFTEAVVLLCATLMVFSSGVTLANTNGINTETPMNPSSAPPTRGLVWDNVIGVAGALGGIIVATVRVNGTAFPADDFKLDTTRQVDSVFWQGGYFQCQLAQGQKDYHWDWRILFWNDDGAGTHPGDVILHNWTIPDASITREFWYNYTNPNTNTYWVANYSCDLPETVTFDADTTYWITFQAIHPTPTTYSPQGCWSRHNITVGGIKLHEAMIKAAWWGYPDWTAISVLVTDHLAHDLNFQLFGPGGDTTPPTTTIKLGGDMSGDVFTSDVTVTLAATDTESGVNYTKYKVDDGAWTEYSDPFVVSGNGGHTVAFYSADIAGNTEEEKSSTFTIQYAIEITIKGGLGVSAAIKNTGTTDLFNISWTITLDGKLIFFGKTKTDIIPTLAVGESVTVRDFVFGFGKTGIAVEAGSAMANTTGTAILIFVIGV